MTDFDGVAFLGVSDILLGAVSRAPASISDDNQALIRSSISRSYYAAYLVARTKLTLLGYVQPTRGHQDHGIVGRALAGRSAILGHDLDRLRAKRNQADYNLNPSGITLTAGRHWRDLARQVIDGINVLT